MNALQLCAVTLLLILASSAPAAERLVLPVPSGPYKVGVQSFDFVDETREETFVPGTKRKLHARVWYPAASVSGEPRLLMTDQELDVIMSNFEKIQPQYGVARAAFRQVPTHSFPGAPIARDQDSFPLLVFSHGGFAFVGSNTAQMEDLASHGYIVMSVTHPYVSAALIYDDGQVVPPSEQLLEDFLDATVRNPDAISKSLSEDPAVRLAQQRRVNREHPLAPHFLIWRDDLIAAVDAFESGAVPPHMAEIATKSDLSRLGYFGMSFGACGVNAAHKDPRAKAAINLDGGNWDPALVDAEVRLPALILHHDAALSYKMMGNDAPAHAHSEFTYEKLATMGTRADVPRLMVRGATHLDFTDYSLLPLPVRDKLRESFSAGPIDGALVQSVMNDFTLAFFDRYVKGIEAAWPANLEGKYAFVKQVDLAYVRDWAKANR